MTTIITASEVTHAHTRRRVYAYRCMRGRRRFPSTNSRCCTCTSTSPCSSQHCQSGSLRTTCRSRCTCPSRTLLAVPEPIRNASRTGGQFIHACTDWDWVWGGDGDRTAARKTGAGARCRVARIACACRCAARAGAGRGAADAEAGLAAAVRSRSARCGMVCLTRPCTKVS